MNNSLDFQPYAEAFAQIDPVLDYSPASLGTLDKLLACLRQGILEQQVSPDQMHWIVVGAAAYFAEILSRQQAVHWRHREGQEPWLDTAAGRLYPFQLARDALAGNSAEPFRRAALRCGIEAAATGKFSP